MIKIREKQRRCMSHQVQFVIFLLSYRKPGQTSTLLSSRTLPSMQHYCSPTFHRLCKISNPPPQKAHGITECGTGNDLRDHLVQLLRFNCDFSPLILFQGKKCKSPSKYHVNSQVRQFLIKIKKSLEVRLSWANGNNSPFSE